MATAEPYPPELHRAAADHQLAAIDFAGRALLVRSSPIITEHRHMVDSLPLDGPVDIGCLDAYLLSDNAPENSMRLSDIDGFLTGLVAGPEVIPPSDWLPVIWGHENPQFVDDDEMRTIFRTVIARYNEIVGNLAADPPTLDPIFMSWSDGDMMIVSDWAAGFLDAVKLRPKAWASLITNDDNRSLLLPFLVHGEQPEDAELLGMTYRPISADTHRKLMPQAPDALIACTIAIWRFWRQRDPHVTKLVAGNHVRKSSPRRRR